MAPVSRQFRGRSRRKSKSKTRSTLVLLGIVLLWSVTMGWGLALLAQSSPVSSVENAQAQLITQSVDSIQSTPEYEPDGAIDPVPEDLAFGQATYLERCATCHIGVPPAVLPTETWRLLLQDTSHYGVEIQPLYNPFLQLIWRYIQAYSRAESANDEILPFRIGQSRFFKALHPDVELPKPLQLQSCVACHPGAEQFHFRTLASRTAPETAVEIPFTSP